MHFAELGPLDARPIAAYLLRCMFHTVRSSLTIRFITLRERVLLPGGPVADPLPGTVTICRAEPSLGRAGIFLPLFVLPRRPARLSCVDERRAAAVFAGPLL